VGINDVKYTGRTWRIGGVVVAAAAALLAAACGGQQPTKAAGPAASAPAATSQTKPPPAAAALRTGEQFMTLKMPSRYTPAAPSGGTDEYRCFVIDPKLTTTAYLTGSQFLPDNVAIVHHAIFFRIDAAQASAARQLDAAEPGEGWTCFGDTGVDGPQSWVASWAPGANETLLANANLGYRMTPGSLLVMQVHYNLLATGGKAGPSDQSSIRLRMRTGASATGLTALQTVQLPAPVELPCAAGESGPLCDRATAMKDVTKRFGPGVGSVETKLLSFCYPDGKVPTGDIQSCTYPVRDGGTIYAVNGHMHLLGRSIKIELNPGTAKAQTLLDVPLYNFDNQATHPLATPVRVQAGDQLKVTCRHDAALRGMLPAMRNQPARYVVWGDGTSDEMCLGLVVMTPDA
jgi:hypothetical protein